MSKLNYIHMYEVLKGIKIYNHRNMYKNKINLHKKFNFDKV